MIPGERGEGERVVGVLPRGVHHCDDHAGHENKLHLRVLVEGVGFRVRV